MRLVAAEYLKLRRRTGLVLATFGLTIVPALIMVVATGGGDLDTGGTRSFAEQVGMLAGLSLIAGVFVGATVATSDTASGVFRELVATGRSRLDLYAARVPPGLALVLVATAAGFAIAALSATTSAGSVEATPWELGTHAPSAGLLVESAAWLLLVAAVGFALAFGVSAVFGSPSGAIATLLALWLVVTPLTANVESLDWLRDLLVLSALDEVMPLGLVAGESSIHLSVTATIALLLGWTSLPLLAGAWRTMTRDA
jgi:ABC-2 family transporter protein